MEKIKNIRVGKRFLFVGKNFGQYQGETQVEYFLNVDKSYGDFDYEEKYIVKKKKVLDYEYEKKAHQIAYMDEEGANGYRLFLDGNGDFGYIREEDNLVLPYRFDVATDFNEYGFAMIGDYGNVTWINKDFDFFDPDKNKFVDPTKESITAYREIHEFRGFENPLSKVVGFDDTVSYLNNEGKLQGFRCVYKDDSIASWEEYVFDDLKFTSFNKQGLMIPEEQDTILVEDGYLYFGEKAKQILNNLEKPKVKVKK